MIPGQTRLVESVQDLNFRLDIQSKVCISIDEKNHIRYQNYEQSRQELGTFLDNKVDTVKILKRNKLLTDIIKGEFKSEGNGGFLLSQKTIFQITILSRKF